MEKVELPLCIPNSVTQSIYIENTDSLTDQTSFAHKWHLNLLPPINEFSHSNFRTEHLRGLNCCLIPDVVDNNHDLLRHHRIATEDSSYKNIPSVNSVIDEGSYKFGNKEFKRSASYANDEGTTDYNRIEILDSIRYIDEPVSNHFSPDTKQHICDKLENEFAIDASNKNIKWDLLCDDNCYGISISLYEQYPDGTHYSGDPNADVFAIYKTGNLCILSIADGVNWGIKARLAAQCAVKASLHSIIHSVGHMKNSTHSSTLVMFDYLLRSFTAAHIEILKNNGGLTTLTIAVICESIKTTLNSENKDEKNKEYTVCICKVGDSNAYAFDPQTGLVIDLTQESRNVRRSTRNLRDAEGALGPAINGLHPELHNLSLSQTTLSSGQIVFLTTDGVSDNMDPVVRKLALMTTPQANARKGENVNLEKNSNKFIERPHHDALERNGLLNYDAKNNLVINYSKIWSNIWSSGKSNKIDWDNNLLPSIDLTCKPDISPLQRHRLTLLHMGCIILDIQNIGELEKYFGNINDVKEAYKDLSRINLEWNLQDPIEEDVFLPNNLIGNSLTARDLCARLLNYCVKVTESKRRILENPKNFIEELGNTKDMDESRRFEYQRARRKMARRELFAAPGKLDHATIVAYKIHL
ncbi:uncharacterized protein LOC135927626 isoform X3 [Gordionus sp. m RMFG-2023]